MWGSGPYVFSLRKPDEDVDTTPLFSHSVAWGSSGVGSPGSSGVGSPGSRRIDSTIDGLEIETKSLLKDPVPMPYSDAMDFVEEHMDVDNTVDVNLNELQNPIIRNDSVTLGTVDYTRTVDDIPTLSDHNLQNLEDIPNENFIMENFSSKDGSIPWFDDIDLSDFNFEELFGPDWDKLELLPPTSMELPPQTSTELPPPTSTELPPQMTVKRFKVVKSSEPCKRDSFQTRETVLTSGYPRMLFIIEYPSETKMKKNMKQNLNLLLLSKSSPKQRRMLLRNADKSQIVTMSEICLNVLAGNVPVNVMKLRKYKTCIRKEACLKFTLRDRIMSKRIAVVPPELFLAYYVQKPEIRVENELSKVLDREQLPDDMKVSQLVSRYQKIVHEPPHPVRVIVVEDESEKNIGTDDRLDAPTKASLDDAVMVDIASSLPHLKVNFYL
ncbi:uncharacterized protein TNCV_1829781 [Trichonephila clavipes]|nr:uncharacterized protein TNCV_1829781 [Trichonephila clavipes]